MSQSSKPYVIVVAVDYSETSNLAFQKALELALGQPLASVHAVNVLAAYDSDLAAAAATSLPPLKQAAETLQHHVAEQREVFRARHPGRSLPFLDDIRAHQRVSFVAPEIAQLAADLEADLVVVGTEGKRGLTRLVLGSTAEATVRLAPCPVLVVRPKTAPLPVPAIEPPCPRCVEARRASGGRETWCEQHRERHGQRHTYHQGDRVGADTNMPLIMRS
ncbi:MAG TPA: universal stress protein [Polyangiaceae bacterium]